MKSEGKNGNTTSESKHHRCSETVQLICSLCKLIQLCIRPSKSTIKVNSNQKNDAHSFPSLTNLHIPNLASVLARNILSFNETVSSPTLLQTLLKTLVDLNNVGTDTSTEEFLWSGSLLPGQGLLCLESDVIIQIAEQAWSLRGKSEFNQCMNFSLSLLISNKYDWGLYKLSSISNIETLINFGFNAVFLNDDELRHRVTAFKNWLLFHHEFASPAIQNNNTLRNAFLTLIGSRE